MSQGSPWESGKTVGRYTLLAAIAKGGMGEIWLARQSGPEGFERVVVVKRIIDDGTGSMNLEGMLLDEARIAAQLNHPNIVQVYELGEFEGSYFIAMEYLHGENLASVVRRGIAMQQPLPVACAARILAGAAEALAYAHAKKSLDGKPLGLVHRDVSPQNIIVTYDGNVKLVDFGIAKAMGRSVKTQDGSIKGKFAYMSPEQTRGESLDARSDIFSLGVVLFEVLSQSRFFLDREDAVAFQMLAQGAELPGLRERAPQLPGPLYAVTERALERRREDRYATARDFAAELEAWLKKTDEGSASQLEAWLQRSFVDRIAQREQLMARAAATGPVSANDVMVKSDRSMPGHTPKQPEKTGVASRPRWMIPLIVLSFATGLFGSGLAASFWLMGEAEKKPLPVTDPTPIIMRVVDAGSVAVVAAPVVPPPQAPDAGAAAVATVKRPAAAAKGSLSLVTTPWTQVSLGKLELGDTPLLEKPVPAGLHKVRLRNPEKGIDRVIEVEILPGKNTALRLKL